MLAQVDGYVLLPPKQDSVKMSPPVVVNESLVISFKYWNGSIQRGIRYNSDLYGFLQNYATTERLKAYEVAYQKAEQGYTVCITVSKTHYSLWLGLRSPNPDAEHYSLPAAQMQPE